MNFSVDENKKVLLWNFFLNVSVVWSDQRLMRVHGDEGEKELIEIL